MIRLRIGDTVELHGKIGKIIPPKENDPIHSMTVLKNEGGYMYLVDFLPYIQQETPFLKLIKSVEDPEE